MLFKPGRVILACHLRQQFSHLCGQFAAVVDVLVDFWMRGLDVGQQATLKGRHILD